MMPEVVTKDTCIGDLIEKYPQTEAVFKRFFGSGCFTCPGAKNEDIAFGSFMHNADVEEVIRELNKAIEKG